MNVHIDITNFVTFLFLSSVVLIMVPNCSANQLNETEARRKAGWAGWGGRARAGWRWAKEGKMGISVIV